MIIQCPWSIGPSILMYHSVADDSDDRFSVTVEDFHDQIRWLISNGFEVISLELLIKLLHAHDHNNLRKKVVITFDDGYKDFVISALPILLEFGVTATVFLATGLLGGVDEWSHSRECVPLMTRDEVCHIKANGISLGSHTSTHADLMLSDDVELQRQLKVSYDVLTQLGELFHTFSYPWGRWSERIVDVVQATGYECALAVGEQSKLSFDNRFCLPRITMRRDVDINQFKLLLNRSYLDIELRRRYGVLRRFISKAKP